MISRHHLLDLKTERYGRMKKFYQICHTSHKEVMFRDESDVGYYLNCMALAAFATGSEIVVEAELTTHVHTGLYTDNPCGYSHSLCQRYTKYFDRKYGRQGPLRDREPFISEVEGFAHKRAFVTYVLRNSLHHGISPTPFAYPYSTVNQLFTKDLGREQEASANWTRAEMKTFLPRHADFPDEYEMNSSGIFLRRSFMELQKAEAYYVTPRSYLFNMNMITDERWLAEQDKDGSINGRITLDSVEIGYPKPSIDEMLRNENGFKYRENRITDFELCRIIDREMLGRFGISSVYQLSEGQKIRIMRELVYDLHVPEAMARRCLAILE